MKKLAVLICFLFYPLSIQIYGLDANSLTGHWEGEITREGKQWRVWLDVKSGNSKPDGTADFPDFGLYALPVEINAENEKVKIEIKDGSSVVVFEGIQKKGNFSGVWNGLNITADFNLKHTSPTPLDLYTQESVTFQSGEATLAGTLIKPNKKGKHPAIVFTHGSGNQTRSETFYRSRAYLFARNGIAALIYDRRGRGESKGGDVTWNNLADDAIAGLKMLQARSDINPKRIGIGGFSQGGWISPLAAVRSEDVAFILVGSAAAVTPEQQNDYNAENSLLARGVGEETIKTVMNLRNRVNRFLNTGSGNKTELENEIAKLKTEKWFRYALLPEKLEPYDDASVAYITFDPAPVWEKVDVPVCSLWGEKDSVVPVEKSKAIIEDALDKGGNKNYLFKVFSDAGHGVSIVQDKDEAWDFPRLAPGYQETMIGCVLKNSAKK